MWWVGRGDFQHQPQLLYFQVSIQEHFHGLSASSPPFHSNVSESIPDRSGVDLFIEPQQGTVSFKKREILIVAQESFGKLETVYPQSNLRKPWDMLQILSTHLSSSYEVPPAFSWNSTHASKFIAKVNVEIFLDHVVNPSYHLFTNRIAHHGEFAIAYKGREGGGCGGVCRGVAGTDPQTKMWMGQHCLGR